jgi:hypothetical protein
MAQKELLIEVDTSKIEDATNKVEYLIDLTERFIDLCKSSKFLCWLFGIKYV